jgi:thymidine phosphorylase
VTRGSKSDPPALGGRPHRLLARRVGLDTQAEAVVLMRKDCPVCRAEGFAARTRVLLRRGERSVIATLYQAGAEMLGAHEAGLSDSAWLRLGLEAGGEIEVSHAPPLESLSLVRGKIYGNRFDAPGLQAIVADITAGRYSDIDLASFITACSARQLEPGEMTALTRAMVESGERIEWGARPVMDKHSVGGLPGNRTTPIVVAIAAAAGLIMPKTSSRAITSPAGTADSMETLAPVDLDLAAMRRVVEREGACIVWGGTVRLSPADDIIIRVERALDLDSEGLMVASVLSKKIAAGATHLVIDLPVGPTAKVRSEPAARSLAESLSAVASDFGLRLRAVATDGTQPVGRGVGPALEARDVLRVLQRDPDAPADLRHRALQLAGAVLELGGKAGEGEGDAVAAALLADGHAWAKFQRICEAQGGLRTPPVAGHRHAIAAERAGQVARIDNRRLAKVAKLSGAPEAKAAGLEIQVRIGDPIEAGQPLYTVHAESPGELAYALDYAAHNSDIVKLVDR